MLGDASNGWPMEDIFFYNNFGTTSPFGSCLLSGSCFLIKLLVTWENHATHSLILVYRHVTGVDKAVEAAYIHVDNFSGRCQDQL